MTIAEQYKAAIEDGNLEALMRIQQLHPTPTVEKFGVGDEAYTFEDGSIFQKFYEFGNGQGRVKYRTAMTNSK